jgi:hypothetical protein
VNGKPIIFWLRTVHRLPFTVHSFLRFALCSMPYALYPADSSLPGNKKKRCALWLAFAVLHIGGNKDD